MEPSRGGGAHACHHRRGAAGIGLLQLSILQEGAFSTSVWRGRGGGGDSLLAVLMTLRPGSSLEDRAAPQVQPDHPSEDLLSAPAAFSKSTKSLQQRTLGNGWRRRRSESRSKVDPGRNLPGSGIISEPERAPGPLAALELHSLWLCSWHRWSRTSSGWRLPGRCCAAGCWRSAVGARGRSERELPGAAWRGPGAEEKGCRSGGGRS